jgi:rhodanese-related sulfurtransferase
MKKFNLRHLLASAVIGGLLFSTSAYAGAPSPQTVQGATTVDAAHAKKLWQDGAVFLDTRKQADWDAGHIPEAIHADRKNHAVYNQAAIEAQIPKSSAVVSYCNGEDCLRSSETAEDLVHWGYGKVYYFRDGFPAWKSAGNPLE